MEQTKNLETTYHVNPSLQGKKYKLTPESKEFLDKGKSFLKEKVKNLTP